MRNVDIVFVDGGVDVFDICHSAMSRSAYKGQEILLVGSLFIFVAVCLLTLFERLRF